MNSSVRNGIHKVIPACAALGFSLAVVACGALPGGNGGLRAPNYASPVGTDSWEVNCGRDKFVIDEDALEDFYNEDGSAKSYTEFCRDNEASLINR